MLLLSPSNVVVGGHCGAPIVLYPPLFLLESVSPSLYVFNDMSVEYDDSVEERGAVCSIHG